MMKWLMPVARRAGPLVARQLVQVVLTVAVSAGALSAACSADVLRLLDASKLFGS